MQLVSPSAVRRAEPRRVSVALRTHTEGLDDVEQQVFPLLDQQRINISNRPYNDHFVVRASPVHGDGLFTRPNRTVHRGDHVAHYGGELIDLDQFWETYPDQRDARYVVQVGGRHFRDAVHDMLSLGRYVNTGDRLNVELVVDTRARTARYVATRTIHPGTEVFGPYGMGNRRSRGGAASVSEMPTVFELTHPHEDVKSESQSQDNHGIDVGNKHDHDKDEKSDVMDEDMITVEPAFPMSRSQEEEFKTRAAMEYRGKTAPPSREERDKLIDQEHA